MLPVLYVVYLYESPLRGGKRAQALKTTRCKAVQAFGDEYVETVHVVRDAQSSGARRLQHYTPGVSSILERHSNRECVVWQLAISELNVRRFHMHKSDGIN